MDQAAIEKFNSDLILLTSSCYKAGFPQERIRYSFGGVKCVDSLFVLNSLFQSFDIFLINKCVSALSW